MGAVPISGTFAHRLRTDEKINFPKTTTYLTPTAKKNANASIRHFRRRGRQISVRSKARIGRRKRSPEESHFRRWRRRRTRRHNPRRWKCRQYVEILYRGLSGFEGGTRARFGHVPPLHCLRLHAPHLGQIHQKLKGKISNDFFFHISHHHILSSSLLS